MKVINNTQDPHLMEPFLLDMKISEMKHNIKNSEKHIVQARLECNQLEEGIMKSKYNNAINILSKEIRRSKYILKALKKRRATVYS